jgi:hypothetical protein
MGTIHHHALVATTSDAEQANLFAEWLEENELQGRFVRTPKVMNGHQSFFFPPDGSKEGWHDSELGDDIRKAVIARLAQDDYEDGSSSWKWVEVAYGELGQTVVRGNNKNELAELKEPS